MDVFATLVLLFVVVVQTYTLFDKVVSTRDANLQTFDLRLPVWPFYAVAWIGDVAAVLLIAVRTWRLIFHPELIKKPDESRAGIHRRGQRLLPPLWERAISIHVVRGTPHPAILHRAALSHKGRGAGRLSAARSQ